MGRVRKTEGGREGEREGGQGRTTVTIEEVWSASSRVGTSIKTEREGGRQGGRGMRNDENM